mmetsp:Transcript_22176/g.68271  ORF Transcript_22176/g.68271 Transcript_22176/m.68271 type:complete len:126 (-) Transcript_22176:445-822(-)
MPTREKRTRGTGRDPRRASYCSSFRSASTCIAEEQIAASFPAHLRPRSGPRYTAHGVAPPSIWSGPHLDYRVVVPASFPRPRDGRGEQQPRSEKSCFKREDNLHEHGEHEQRYKHHRYEQHKQQD